jgi:hypothetical protein
MFIFSRMHATAYIPQACTATLHITSCSSSFCAHLYPPFYMLPATEYFMAYILLVCILPIPLYLTPCILLTSCHSALTYTLLSVYCQPPSISRLTSYLFAYFPFPLTSHPVSSLFTSRHSAFTYRPTVLSVHYKMIQKSESTHTCARAQRLSNHFPLSTLVLTGAQGLLNHPVQSTMHLTAYILLVYTFPDPLHIIPCITSMLPATVRQPVPSCCHA